MEADFSGYVTRNNIKCSDGRTILADAFKHQAGMKVPLVWQHQHNDPGNILGHMMLENRADGVYGYGYFNDTENALTAKAAVQHEDINQLSIFANGLREKNLNVEHGDIKEVSLVIAGANSGAYIENINLKHADGHLEWVQNEAIIYPGLTLKHDDGPDEGSEGGSVTDDKKSVQDLFNEFTPEQKEVVGVLIAASLATVEHSDKTGESLDDKSKDKKTSEDDKTGSEDDKSKDKTDSTDDKSKDLKHSQEGNDMTRNVFENNNAPKRDRAQLTHDQLTTIMTDAQKPGQTLKSSFLAHAVEYGIENIDYLFPDAKTLDNAPELVARRMEWVTTVLNGAKHNPFSRIKTLSADITHDEARAKGYIKGTLKKDEWFGLTKRITTPTTIYKKQKLDRDDIIDIVDLDVVAWLKAEMRLMIDEEIARAALVGDGREVDDEDKVKEPAASNVEGAGIRSIAHDHEFYSHKVTIPTNVVGDALVEAVLRARPMYRGAGNPTAFMTEDVLTDLILVKDKMGRRLYPTQSELETALRVSKIVTVPVMENQQTDEGELLMILVNMSDYTFGADKGGALAMFDDFDIDYNQYKYLMETRLSGTLTKFKSALVFSRANGTEVTPAVPTFVPATGVVTIVATTGVTYKNQETDATLSTGAQTALAAGDTLSVVAVPNTGYYFPHNHDADWDFTRPLA